MRQFVLVIVLVAAAFLGGAFVNGPGLRWAQAQLLGSLGLNEEGEIASVDLKGAPGPGTIGEGPTVANPGTGPVSGPLAPMPSLVAEAKSDKGDTSERQSSPPAGGARRPALPPPSPPSEPPPLSASPDREPPALLDPSVKPAVTTNPGGRPPRDRDGAPVPTDTPSVALATLIPSGAPLPPDSPAVDAGAAPEPPSQSGPGPVASGGEDWAALGQRMQALGVSRFTIEGQPGGPVVFSCLIPLAGRQAVTQRFEAEGQDAFHAAQAALRRVALWRATQH